MTSALKRISLAPVDLVLCDVMMPDGGAPRFLSELEKVAAALAAHADRVLAKPLDHVALRAIVRRLLREVPAPTVAPPDASLCTVVAPIL